MPLMRTFGAWLSRDAARGALVGAALVGLSGCRGCKNEHPYVPYTIGDADAPDAEKAVAAPSEDAGAFVEQPAEVAPPDATSWTLGGATLRAPAGSVFQLGLAADLDGDGTPDAVTVTRGADRPNDPGALVVFKGSPQAWLPSSPIATGPLPSAAGCTAARRLAQVGRHSVLVELGAKCAQQPAHEPSRWLAVIALAPVPRVHFSASVVDPPGAPALFFTVDGADRDGDGIDDVAVRVALEGGGAPFEPLARTTATLSWFDRPAGMSRDADGPDGDLRALAANTQVLAAKPASAPGVAPRVRAVRALYSALCGDGGAPRLTKVLGDAPLSCGPSRALEEAGLAEVRAHATMGDALLASAALARAQLPPATRTPKRTTDAEAWILQASPVATATSVRQIAAVPQIARGRQPSWGALAFEPSGKLLVRTVAGVVRVDPETGDEAEAREVSPWPMAVSAPDESSKFLGAHDPCDGVALHVTLGPAADGDTTDVALPIVPALGTRCGPGKDEPVAASPLAWGPAGLEALVDGWPVLVTPAGRASMLQSLTSQTVTPGAPRSPDGKGVVVPTPLGLVVRGPRARTLRAADFDGAYAELRDCAVSDDGARVACVRAGRAWVALY